MKTFKSLIEDILPSIKEVFPWDLQDILDQSNLNQSDLAQSGLAQSDPVLLIDITEPGEFNTVHINHAINVPRGILESACDWGYEDTVPELASARDKEVIVICRSGNRSALAAYTMQLMGFNHVSSLKTGLRGWFDYELALYNGENKQVNEDDAEAYFSKTPRPEQMGSE